MVHTNAPAPAPGRIRPNRSGGAAIAGDSRLKATIEAIYLSVARAGVPSSMVMEGPYDLLRPQDHSKLTTQQSNTIGERLWPVEDGWGSLIWPINPNSNVFWMNKLDKLGVRIEIKQKIQHNNQPRRPNSSRESTGRWGCGDCRGGGFIGFNTLRYPYKNRYLGAYQLGRVSDSGGNLRSPTH